MKYNINSYAEGLNFDSYITYLIQYIQSNKSLSEILNEKIRNNITFKGDILKEIYKNKNIITGNDIDIKSIIRNYLSYL